MSKCTWLIYELLFLLKALKAAASVEVLPEALRSQINAGFHPTVDTLPEQIHLSLGDNDRSMYVLWATQAMASNLKSYVYYGAGVNNFTIKSEANSSWLIDGNIYGCQGMHRALMTGLVPGGVYSYYVQTGQHYSRDYSFKHVDNTINRTVNLIVYGDLGKIGGGATVRLLESDVLHNNYDGIIHVGDYAYDFHDDGGSRGDDFMNRIEGLSSKLAYITCPGNHEIHYDFSHYRYRFSSPNTDWPIPLNKMWYSFDMGLVHFISYSTEVYYTYDQAYVEQQFRWLKDDLQRANRQRDVRPWIIAFGHRPMYCSNINRDDCTKQRSALRTEPYNLEKLFHTEGVDLIIEAHEHSYERLQPLYDGIQTDCGYYNPKSAVHIISGSAGCNEREILCADVFLDTANTWSAYRSWLPGLNGYGRLSVENSTHLFWQQVIALSDQPLDGIWIIQEEHGTRNITNVVEHRCAET